MPKTRSPFLSVHLRLCVPVNTFVANSGQEEKCGLQSEFVLGCMKEQTEFKSKYSQVLRAALSQKSPILCHLQKHSGFYCLKSEALEEKVEFQLGSSNL